MPRKSWLFILASIPIITLLLFPACKKTPKKPKVKEANVLWKKYISGTTTGIVSRKSKIQVEFLSDVFPKERIGQDASNILVTEPPIKGEATIANGNMLMLIPESDLISDQYYLVRIKGQAIESLPEEIGDYEFVFRVIKQDFEVKTEGLTATGIDDKEMELKGTVTTADVEEALKVEGLVEATLKGTKLSLTWTHDETGKKHQFTIAGIKRTEENQNLLISWNGSVIQVDQKDSISIEVPSIDVFKVTDVKAIQGDEQYIIIYFSDNMKTNQNIKGLVRLDQRQYTTRIEGNTIKVFPDKKFVGKITVTLDKNIRNAKGVKLQDNITETVLFTSQKPQVKFAGKGVILPENDVLSIPFEAINVKSVQITAFKIFENNVGQFLQNNQLNGKSELHRTGRYLWRKTIHIPTVDPDNWQRYDLDATDLLKDKPHGIYQLSLSINRGNSSYSCSEEENNVPVQEEKPFNNYEDLYVTERSPWDYWRSYWGYDRRQTDWKDRNDPCKDAYYQHAAGVKDTRNFMASNIGLLAKGDRKGEVRVVATNLQTSEPMTGVNLSVRNFQNQEAGSGVTDGDGFSQIALSGKPFYIIATKGTEVGYLKINQTSVMSVSHFDVGGEEVQEGIKGIIYGERGVWRPGDDIHLVFVVGDKDDILPSDHPVTLRLFNPKNQLMQTMTNSKPVGDFYRFSLKTNESDLTGTWVAKAQVGNRLFTKNLKVETVKPNRLSINVDLGKALYQSQMPQKGTFKAKWLHGATARNLRADIEVRLRSSQTKFDRFSDYVFDDPARDYKDEPKVIFEGNLNNEGNAHFTANISKDTDAPGMMVANFKARVFETGGDFSSSRFSLPYYPYKNYVGLKLPKSEKNQNKLTAGIKHKISIASLNDKGKSVSLRKVKVDLYKLYWRWWYDNTEDDLARYVGRRYNRPIQSAEIKTADGVGEYELEVNKHSWGRYFLRVCDEDGGHCAGDVFYVTYPGWAKDLKGQQGIADNILNLSSDKEEYKVGETAVIRLPKATQGRALISIENGSEVLEQKWIKVSKSKTKFELPIKSHMAPNVYVSVSLIQPHVGKKNDRPIRLYGVIPIEVTDPKTILQPKISVPEKWIPESKVSVSVSESQGRPMTYTLAVVDEGLLGLTNFKTPNLHDHFYKKEALGVSTWDLYDYVVGAYGAELERLLAIGGAGDLEAEPVQENKRRFPPVVKFMGPFQISRKKSKSHEFTLPPYVGSLRVMVIAGSNGAYGHSDKSVLVKEALTILTTVPRVLGPDEEITIPVTVFASEKQVKNVSLTIETDDNIKIVGSPTANITFNKPGEKLVFFKIKVGPNVGQTKILVTGQSGTIKSRSETNLIIRSPNPSTVIQFDDIIEANSTWKQNLTPHGLKGTNEVQLEISAIPPLNLEKRLQYLVRYPHGCIEQTTSSVFPQLYLPALLQLDPDSQKEIENNISAGIERLKQFQLSNGGFVYWPGSYHGDKVNEWGTNYAGHFLVEAKKKGYFVPLEMISDWKKYQQSQANSFDADSQGNDRNYRSYGYSHVMNQAYRLYTLALAGDPNRAAMNRLRESKKLNNVSRWQLAAAYQLAGSLDAAEAEAKKADLLVDTYKSPGRTYGSGLRDRAIILNSMAYLDGFSPKDLINNISDKLSGKDWHSTQSIAYALMAMANYFGGTGSSDVFEYRYVVGSNPSATVKSDKSISQINLANFPLKGADVSVFNNSSKKLFATLSVRGVPPSGKEVAASNGVRLSVRYTDKLGNTLTPSLLQQGQDFKAELTIKNVADKDLEDLALTHIAPSGWEIHNERFDSGEGVRNPLLEYQDIRDDRVLSYFSLKPNQSISLSYGFNATYLGRYYLPGIAVEAMYEASKNARTTGQWIKIVKPAK